MDPARPGDDLRRDGRGRAVPPARVLLVIGTALANLVAVTLRHGWYETRTSTDLAECRRILRDWEPQLVLVDIDHHEPFLATAAGAGTDSHMPTLALTRRRDAALRLSAVERGADGIVDVPFALDEIVTRSFALLRRARGITIPLQPRLMLGGAIEVDLRAQTVTLDGGRALELTPIQQTLLFILAANAGEVLTRETLLASIWGGVTQIESNVVDRHIRELRVKLGDDWRTPRYLETVSGQGYRFRARDAVEDAAAQ